MIQLEINGQRVDVESEPDASLLWVLREQLGLTGTKYSCGIGLCGSCTVLVDGQAEQSCTLTPGDVIGKKLTTIEGGGPIIDTLQRAWLQEDVPQCGYCQPGQILTAADLLSKNPSPSPAEISAAMSPVLCRCGTYRAIDRAINLAIKELHDDND